MSLSPESDPDTCHRCGCAAGSTGEQCAGQSLDELDFLRGVWYPALNGDFSRLKELIESGKYGVDSRDTAGYTALHYAARNGHIAICKYLVNNGADVNAKTKSGGATPLHRALSAGQKEIAEFLLEKKADVLIKDNDGRTALDRAANLKHLIEKALLEHPDASEAAKGDSSRE